MKCFLVIIDVYLDSTVEEIRADHETSSTLPSFTMNHGDILLVILQPPAHILAERSHLTNQRLVLYQPIRSEYYLTKLWRIVIIKWVDCDSRVELGDVIGPLGAEVVDLVVVLVLLLQELNNITHRVPVDGLQIFTGKPHGNDAI